MKNTILLVAFFVVTISFGQDKRDLKLNEEKNLIEVTYFHDNGAISQTGFYTLEGKLQGQWLSFNDKGEKLVLANYDNGKKVGKWFYWIDKTLKEVDYESNFIASVTEWTSDKTRVAVRNK